MARKRRNNISVQQDTAENVPKKVQRTSNIDNKKDEKDKKIGPKKKGRGRGRGSGAGAKGEPPKESRPPIHESDTDDSLGHLDFEQETEVANDSFLNLGNDEDITFRNSKCS